MDYDHSPVAEALLGPPNKCLGELRAGAEPLPVGGCERVRKVPLPPAVVLDLVHVDHGAQVVGLIYPQFEVIRAIMLDDSPYVLHEQSTHRLDEAHHPQPDPRQCRDLEVNRRLIIPNKRQGKRRDMWHQPARRERKRVCGSGG